MKALSGWARNLMIALGDEGQVVPVVEVIFLSGEVAYRADAEGKLIKTRPVEAYRVCASSDALRDLAAALGEWADDLDAMQPRPVEPPAAPEVPPETKEVP